MTDEEFLECVSVLGADVVADVLNREEKKYFPKVLTPEARESISFLDDESNTD